VGLDRFYELWINFAVLLLAVLALAASAATSLVDWRAIALILSGLVLTLALGAWFLLRQPQRIRGWIEALTRPWQKHPRLGQLHAHWSQMHESLQTLVKEKRLALGLALGLSLLGWAGMIAEFWLLLRFVEVDFDLTTFVFLFTVVRLAFLLPLPGGIGSVEAGLFWAFSALALPLPAATGLIALMRLRDVLVLVAGALMLPGMSAAAKVH
jgi:glycosyltransferase 2 family protein